jgi:predicted  nucleic acid-binding Zn-ribbon protein
MPIDRELGLLLSLREVDVEIDEVSHGEADALSRLDIAKTRFLADKEQAASDKKAIDDGLKQRKLLELELKSKDEQKKKYAGQLYEVKTNEQYRAMQEEMEKATKDMAAIEEKILEMMVKEDEIKSRAAKINLELAESEKKFKAVEIEVNAALAQFAERKAGLLAKRKERSGGIPAPLQRRYDRIRSQQGGSPLAGIIRGEKGVPMCASCQMNLRAQTVVEVQKQEELIACDSCGRILYMEDGAKTAETAG